MSLSIAEKILRFIRAVSMSDFNDNAFNDLALELFQYQLEKNAVYRGICRQQGLTPNRMTHWREIPAVTTSAFKEVALTCFPAHEAIAVFHTSGTTRKRAGKHYFRTLDFYRAAIFRSFAAYCLADQITNYELRTMNGKMRMFFLGPTSEHFRNSSLGYMFSEIRDEFGDEGSTVFFTPQGVEVNELQLAIDRAIQENAPVFILGTALALLECMEKFQQSQTFKLPVGSRILDTGGYKGRNVEITRQEFQQRLSETFGVSQEFLLNEYGMTELSSQFYLSSLPDIPLGKERTMDSLHALRFTPYALHFTPPWVRVAAVDPENLQILPENETGLLRIFDLANIDSVVTVQTEDLGRAWQDRIEVIGRASGAELRGCSLLTEAIIKGV